MKNEIKVGDAYLKSGQFLVVFMVKKDSVSYVMTDSMENVYHKTMTLERFNRLEKRTLEKGAEFFPAPEDLTS